MSPIRDFPGVQWLRLHASTAGGLNSISGWRTKVPRASGHSQKKVSPISSEALKQKSTNGCSWGPFTGHLVIPSSPAHSQHSRNRCFKNWKQRLLCLVPFSSPYSSWNFDVSFPQDPTSSSEHAPHCLVAWMRICSHRSKRMCLKQGHTTVRVLSENWGIGVRTSGNILREPELRREATAKAGLKVMPIGSTKQITQRKGISVSWGDPSRKGGEGTEEVKETEVIFLEGHSLFCIWVSYTPLHWPFKQGCFYLTQNAVVGNLFPRLHVFMERDYCRRNYPGFWPTRLLSLPRRGEMTYLIGKQEIETGLVSRLSKCSWEWHRGEPTRLSAVFSSLSAAAINLRGSFEPMCQSLNWF